MYAKLVLTVPFTFMATGAPGETEFPVLKNSTVPVISRSVGLTSASFVTQPAPSAYCGYIVTPVGGTDAKFVIGSVVTRIVGPALAPGGKAVIANGLDAITTRDSGE